MSSEVESAELTVLVLRNVAEHLARGEVMNLAGDWKPEQWLKDSRRPRRRRARRIYEQGRWAATGDAVLALKWVAKANELPQ